MNNFPCDRCGACCRRPHLTAGEEFPYKYINGKCEMLGPENLCKVYATRPDICNFETMLAKLGMDRDFAIAGSKDYCRQFQKEDGITR
jgi:Fe-S-cluster containining protein